MGGIVSHVMKRVSVEDGDLDSTAITPGSSESNTTTGGSGNAVTPLSIQITPVDLALPTQCASPVQVVSTSASSSALEVVVPGATPSQGCGRVAPDLQPTMSVPKPALSAEPVINAAISRSKSESYSNELAPDSFHLTEGQSRRADLVDYKHECTQITDFLFVSGREVAADRDTLQRNGITRIVNCCSSIAPDSFRGDGNTNAGDANAVSVGSSTDIDAAALHPAQHPNDIKYLSLNLVDGKEEDITWFVCEVIHFLFEGKCRGERALVHCEKGVSRSCSFVIAYLIWSTTMRFQEAFQFVKARRGICNPNAAFSCQLIEFDELVNQQVVMHGSPRQSLRVSGGAGAAMGVGQSVGTPMRFSRSLDQNSNEVPTNVLFYRCALHSRRDPTTPALKLCRYKHNRLLVYPALDLFDSEGTYVISPYLNCELGASSRSRDSVSVSVDSAAAEAGSDTGKWGNIFSRRVYLWQGKFSDDRVVAVALRLAQLTVTVFSAASEFIVVKEGNEAAFPDFLELINHNKAQNARIITTPSRSVIDNIVKDDLFLWRRDRSSLALESIEEQRDEAVESAPVTTSNSRSDAGGSSKENITVAAAPVPTLTIPLAQAQATHPSLGLALTLPVAKGRNGASAAETMLLDMEDPESPSTAGTALPLSRLSLADIQSNATTDAGSPEHSSGGLGDAIAVNADSKQSLFDLQITQTPRHDTEATRASVPDHSPLTVPQALATHQLGVDDVPSLTPSPSRALTATAPAVALATSFPRVRTASGTEVAPGGASDVEPPNALSTSSIKPQPPPLHPQPPMGLLTPAAPTRPLAHSSSGERLPGSNPRLTHRRLSLSKANQSPSQEEEHDQAEIPVVVASTVDSLTPIAPSAPAHVPVLSLSLPRRGSVAPDEPVDSTPIIVRPAMPKLTLAATTLATATVTPAEAEGGECVLSRLPPSLPASTQNSLSLDTSQDGSCSITLTTNATGFDSAPASSLGVSGGASKTKPKLFCLMVDGDGDAEQFEDMGVFDSEDLLEDGCAVLVADDVFVWLGEDFVCPFQSDDSEGAGDDADADVEERVRAWFRKYPQLVAPLKVDISNCCFEHSGDESDSFWDSFHNG